MVFNVQCSRFNVQPVSDSISDIELLNFELSAIQRAQP
jgi:hypothetical protein